MEWILIFALSAALVISVVYAVKMAYDRSMLEKRFDDVSGRCAKVTRELMQVASDYEDLEDRYNALEETSSKEITELRSKIFQMGPTRAELIAGAKKLRANGKSYNEIAKALQISKSSAARFVKQ